MIDRQTVAVRRVLGQGENPNVGRLRQPPTQRFLQLANGNGGVVLRREPQGKFSIRTRFQNLVRHHPIKLLQMVHRRDAVKHAPECIRQRLERKKSLKNPSGSKKRGRNYLGGIARDDEESLQSGRHRLERLHWTVNGEIHQLQVLQLGHSGQGRFEEGQDVGAGGSVFESNVSELGEPAEGFVVALFGPEGAVAQLQTVQVRQLRQMGQFRRVQVGEGRQAERLDLFELGKGGQTAALKAQGVVEGAEFELFQLAEVAERVEGDGRGADELSVDAPDADAVGGDRLDDLGRTFAQVDPADFRQVRGGRLQIVPRLLHRRDEEHLPHVQVLSAGPAQVAGEQGPVVDPRILEPHYAPLKGIGK